MGKILAGDAVKAIEDIEERLAKAWVDRDRMVVDEVKVRVYGDVAVATGRTQATGSYRGSSASVVLRFTDVFVWRDGRWQAVVSHGSMVAQ